MSTPWMPFYVADYLADTRRLDTLEHGAYMLLILEYWRQGGLPKDDATLARLVLVDASTWARIKPVISSFFDADWRHKRIDAELEKAREKNERRQDAGRRGGLAKAERQSSNATAMLEQCSTNALASSSQPQPHSSSLRSDEPRVKPASDLEFLETFWPKYPHKVGKPDAAKAFARARKSSSLEQIMAGLDFYVSSKPADRPWLNPSTFLNQERFNDRPATVSARASPQETGRSLLARLATGNFNEPDHPPNVIELNARPPGRSDGPNGNGPSQSFGERPAWGSFDFRPTTAEHR